MAITNAQQYQQLVNKPANGKRPGYRGDAAYGPSSRSNQATSMRAATSSRSVSPGGGNSRRGGDVNLGDGPASKGFDQNAAPGGQDSNVYGPSGPYNPDAALAAAKAQGKFDKKNPVEKTFDFLNKTYGKSLYNRFPNNPKNELAYLRSLPASQRALLSPALRAKLEAIEDEATFDDYTTAGQKFTFEEFEDLKNFTPTEGLNFADYAAKYQGAPGLKYSGNVGNLEKYVTKRGPDGRPLEYGYREKMGGDGDGAMSDYERRLLELENQLKNQQNNNTNSNVPNSGLGGLAPRFAGSIFDFTGLADGGRAGMMDGGMMEDTPEGGIMDLESGRQMYFLGKLVKKATRAVKKVVKSPFGKMALLGLGAGMAGFGPAKGLFASGKGLGFKKFLTDSILGEKTFGLGPPGYSERTGGILNFIKNNPYKSIFGGSALLGLMSGKEEDDKMDLDDYYKRNSINIADIRNNPYNFLAPRIAGSQFAADGGLMRTGYQEGGDAEPVAKKTMPLLDMDGMEKDYREDGGFVPIGRMERADDVPARLSKNEFVFTADAVRNAGEGDIDKGAEVMYNMMKNLESGGEVSEESQGLDGAREMFKTSKRLEEVL